MTHNDIIDIFCPDTIPTQTGYLWALFPIERSVVEGCGGVYYCASGEVADELFAGQIKSKLDPQTNCFTIHPINDMIQIGGTNLQVSASFSRNPAIDIVQMGGTNTPLHTTFNITHYGCYDSHQSASIARVNTTLLMEFYRHTQQRYISGIIINNTSFGTLPDDNSHIQKYTATVTVSSITPYILAPNCK